MTTISGKGFVREAQRMCGTATGRVLLMLCLMYFITYVDRVNLSTAAPVIKKEFGLSNTELGWVLSAFAYPYALFQIAGGFVGDRFGPRMTLGVCGFIWAVATVLTGFTGGIASLFLARVMLGFGEGATFPTATRAMSNWTPKGERGYAQGITHSFARLGNAVTPPVVAALIAWVTWRGSFVVLGLISAVWLAVWVLYFRDDPKTHRGVSRSELEILPDYDTRGGKAKTAADRVPWGRLVPRMMPTTIVYFCYGWTLWLYLTWLPSYFVQAHGLNLKDSAMFSFGVFFAGVIGDTLGGVVSDRVYQRTGDLAKARRNTILISLIGSLLCLLPVLFVQNLVVLAFCLSGAFFFLELTIGPIWSVPMDIAPKHSGVASGIMNTGSAIAAIVSPLAFGWITDVTGNFTLPFLVSIALLLIGAGLSFLMRPDIQIADDDVPVADTLAPQGGVARPAR